MSSTLPPCPTTPSYETVRALAGKGSGVPTQTDALPLNEIWSIERVVAEVVGTGDLDHVACLQADIGGARIGHGLREAFEPRVAKDWFDGDHLGAAALPVGVIADAEALAVGTAPDGPPSAASVVVWWKYDRRPVRERPGHEFEL